VAVPSRRPKNTARLWQAMQETCTGDTTLLVGVDDDDPNRENYPVGPEYVIQQHPGSVVAWINALTVPYVDQYRYIGTIGDDNLPETPGWDVKITAALEETPFAFGNDKYLGRPAGSLCCHVFCRSEVIAALGYFGPPEFQSMYVDDVWMAWGKACGITYLDDVSMEHLHWTQGKAPLDKVYARSAAQMKAGRQAYSEYRWSGLRADVLTIQRAISSQEKE
jgi:hypothetical protein